MSDQGNTARAERADAIATLFRSLREQGFRLVKEDTVDITLTADQRTRVEQLIAANEPVRGTPLRRHTCECGCSHPAFRCRRWETPHDPHFWPAKASDTTFYCDGGDLAK